MQDDVNAHRLTDRARDVPIGLAGPQKSRQTHFVA